MGPDAHLSEEVPAALDGERLDRLVALMAGCSRAEAAGLVHAGGVRVSGLVVHKSSHRVVRGDVVTLARDPRREARPPMPDPSVAVTVLHADADIVVVDKPAGLVVHPGAGHPDGTLVNGLLARFPDLQDVGDPMRPGVVHRLDRETSGLLVVARTDAAYRSMVDQLAAHRVERTYTALVWRHPAHPQGVVDAPVGRSRRDPLRMAVTEEGRPARTRYRVERTFRDPVEVALLTCELETGRTHQIRVHLSSIGHPVVGDPLYGGRRQSLAVDRPFLHARHLRLRHPSSGVELDFDAPLPPDLAAVLSRLD